MLENFSYLYSIKQLKIFFYYIYLPINGTTIIQIILEDIKFQKIVTIFEIKKKHNLKF